MFTMYLIIAQIPSGHMDALGLYSDKGRDAVKPFVIRRMPAA